MAAFDLESSLPLVREAFPRTIRLVSSARLRESVLTPLGDTTEELDLLAEIEGATSERLIAEERGLGALGPDELVHAVPHAKFINASFAYAKPREPMRLNPADRGAWYSALAIETCIAEVGFHLGRELIKYRIEASKWQRAGSKMAAVDSHSTGKGILISDRSHFDVRPRVKRGI